MDTKNFFESLRWWYEDAKKSTKWSEFQYRDGRLHGMIEIAQETKVISINTWKLLTTLLQKLSDVTIEKGLK
jgi:hypothetical protein